jgi:hypothetical protein
MVDRDHYASKAGQASHNEEDSADLLPSDFIPGKWDVICQRGKECFEHGKDNSQILKSAREISKLIVNFSR